MENFKQAVELAKQLVASAEKLETKHTKVESKRARALLTDMKKVATLAKSDLVSKDKE